VKLAGGTLLNQRSVFFDRKEKTQDERRVFCGRSILLLRRFLKLRAAYKASGAISTPFGQARVPASMKNFLKDLLQSEWVKLA